MLAEMERKLGDKEEEVIHLHEDGQKMERTVADQAKTIQSLQVRYACTLAIHCHSYTVCSKHVIFPPSIDVFCHF